MSWYRWEVAREYLEGFSPRGHLASPRMQDAPIWVQPRGAFHINFTPGTEMTKHIIIQFVPLLMTFIDRGGRETMLKNVTCLRRHGGSIIVHGNRNITTTCPSYPGHCESTEGLSNQRCSLASGCGNISLSASILICHNCKLKINIRLFVTSSYIKVCITCSSWDEYLSQAYISMIWSKLYAW